MLQLDVSSEWDVTAIRLDIFASMLAHTKTSPDTCLHCALYKIRGMYMYTCSWSWECQVKI